MLTFLTYIEEKIPSIRKLDLISKFTHTYHHHLIWDSCLLNVRAIWGRETNYINQITRSKFPTRI